LTALGGITEATIFLSLNASAIDKSTLTEVDPAKFSLNLPSMVNRIRVAIGHGSGSGIAISIVLNTVTSEHKLGAHGDMSVTSQP
jgi:hypothetical protein